IPACQTRYWRPTRSPLTRMTQSDAKPNRLTKYRSGPTTTRSNTAPDRASAGTSRSRDKVRANNSAADLATAMAPPPADPHNTPPGPALRQINHPRRPASMKRPGPSGLSALRLPRLPDDRPHPRNHPFRVSSAATRPLPPDVQAALRAPATPSVGH